MRCVLALCLVVSAYAQELRVTAQALSADTTHAMFGRLPKAVSAVRVDVCNQTAAALTVPLARLNQQTTMAAGLTVLPHDVAFVVIAAAQGNSTAQKIVRWGFFGVSIVAIGANWSTASTPLRQALTGVALAGGQTIGLLGTAIPSHAFLQFDRESLPDPLQLAPLGCETGISLVEKQTNFRQVDFSMQALSVQFPVSSVSSLPIGRP